MTSYVINTGAVSFERFDHETVIVNFERGTYFSLTGSAPEIWQLLTEPRSVASIEAAVAAAGGSDDGSIGRMLATLAAEGCLIALDAGAPLAATPALLLGGPFQPPGLLAFHDLQELIAIDPVHDADAFDGWPHRPPVVTLG